MARGWESKSVEMQMESVRASLGVPIGHKVSIAELAHQRQKESIELSRTRILNDLEKAANPRYREVLLASLAFLDQKLKLLN